MKIVWVLIVLVFADGEWREWDHHYSRFEECEEVRQTILYRREDKMTARCETRFIPPSPIEKQ